MTLPSFITTAPTMGFGLVLPLARSARRSAIRMYFASKDCGGIVFFAYKQNEKILQSPYNSEDATIISDCLLFAIRYPFPMVKTRGYARIVGRRIRHFL